MTTMGTGEKATRATVSRGKIAKRAGAITQRRTDTATNGAPAEFGAGSTTARRSSISES